MEDNYTVVFDASSPKLPQTGNAASTKDSRQGSPTEHRPNQARTAITPGLSRFRSPARIFFVTGQNQDIVE